MTSIFSSRQTILPLRRWLLNTGTLLALSLYYLNYHFSFVEGETQGGGALTLFVRAISVALIVLSVLPFSFSSWQALISLGLFLFGGVGLILGAGFHGGFNDTLFFNTLLQLPILVALVGTSYEVNYRRWMNFISKVLVVQVLIDLWIWQFGTSLWLSMAFIGGVGNPTSFGVLCVIGLTHCICQAKFGFRNYLVALLLVFGAIQSKALLAAIAAILIVCIWLLFKRKRNFKAALFGLFIPLFLFINISGENFNAFLIHKLKSFGALLHFVEYDVDSSISVSLRMDMHTHTFKEIADSPLDLLWGHLGALPYWPMDSQLLTYLGSFGAPFLMIFIFLHAYWTINAWRMRQADHGFALITLCIFGLTFATNRILDYFPMALIYFGVVASIHHAGSSIKYKKD